MGILPASQTAPRLGKYLGSFHYFGPAVGIYTLLIEASFLPLILLLKDRRALAFLGISFHLGIWMTMNISFWHLWVFYPVLFWRTARADAH